MQAHSCMASDKRRDTPAYWEARLQRMRLGMETGHVDWISYGHEVTKLDTDGRKTFAPIAGEIEDVSEWPLSLM